MAKAKSTGEQAFLSMAELLNAQGVQDWTTAMHGRAIAILARRALCPPIPAKAADFKGSNEEWAKSIMAQRVASLSAKLEESCWAYCSNGKKLLISEKLIPEKPKAEDSTMPTE